MSIVDLEPVYYRRKSYYGKATVRTVGNRKILTSYTTDVAYIEDGKAVVYDWYSHTTMRHIKDFLYQNGFELGTSDEILERYKED